MVDPSATWLTHVEKIESFTDTIFNRERLQSALAYRAPKVKAGRATRCAQTRVSLMGCTAESVVRHRTSIR